MAQGQLPGAQTGRTGLGFDPCVAGGHGVEFGILNGEQPDDSGSGGVLYIFISGARERAESQPGSHFVSHPQGTVCGAVRQKRLRKDDAAAH